VSAPESQGGKGGKEEEEEEARRRRHLFAFFAPSFRRQTREGHLSIAGERPRIIIKAWLEGGNSAKSEKHTRDENALFPGRRSLSPNIFLLDFPFSPTLSLLFVVAVVVVVTSAKQLIFQASRHPSNSDD